MGSHKHKRDDDQEALGPTAREHGDSERCLWCDAREHLPRSSGRLEARVGLPAPGRGACASAKDGLADVGPGEEKKQRKKREESRKVNQILECESYFRIFVWFKAKFFFYFRFGYE